MKAENTIRAGHIGAVALLDISCFFDHLDPNLTSVILHRLGIQENVICWTHSFMADHKVQMSFNGYTSEEFDADRGAPQGSPFSPLLSALFTGPLLEHAKHWDDAELSLYVNDGNIFASRPTFTHAACIVKRHLEEVVTWLRELGLTIDSDKTEFMFFHPPLCKGHQEQLGPQPCFFAFMDGDGHL
jgi:hypothetical protein